MKTGFLILFLICISVSTAMFLNNSANESLCLYNGSVINNATLCHRETDMQTEDGNQMSLRLNLFVICALLISTGCNIVALRVILRCRKLPISIRYLSANFLVGFLMIGISTIIHSTAMIVFGLDSYNYELIFDIRMFFFCVFLAVLWCSMCAVTAERFIAIVFPYKYVLLTRKSILYITITFIWMINITVPSAFVIYNLLNFCGQIEPRSSCDMFAILRPFRIFVSSVLCISFVVTTVLYFKILLCIQQTQTKTRALDMKTIPTENKEPSATKSTPPTITNTILIIILSFLILQSPYLIVIIITELIPESQHHNWRAISQIMCYICHEINTFVTLFHYIWWFPECRMTFYHMFSRVSQRCRTKAEILRIEVYNIVTFERKNIEHNA